MNKTWIIVMSILGVVLIVTGIFICKMCIRDYKHILQLTAPVHPTTPTIENLPVTIGRRVYYMNENLQIIDIENI